MIPGVYFIQAEQGGPVKIGYSRDIPIRLNDLQRQCPMPLRCLGSLTPAPISLERYLHDRFAQFRLHGEWFEPVPPILDLAFSKNGAVEQLRATLAPSEVAELLGVGVDFVRAEFDVMPIGSRGERRVLKVDYDEVAERVCEERVRRLVKLTLKRTLERLGPIAEELITDSLAAMPPATCCAYENSPKAES